MPTYSCRVADERGRITVLLREAASEEPLLRELSSRSLFVLSVRELSQGETAPTTVRRFSRRVVAELTDLLTLMLGSGLSLKDSLEVAQTVSHRGPGNELVILLLERIRKGATLAAALEGTGATFPSVYRGMVRIGERIGNLDQVFARLSSYLGDEKKLRDRIGAALLYPAIVLGVAIMSVVLVVVVLFPRLREIFSQVGQGLAAKVESLMSSLTTAFTVIGVLAAAAVVLCALAARLRRRGGPVAARIDAFLLRVPVLSSFLFQRELLNLAFAMETLTASGVSVEEALSESAGSLGNAALKEEVTAIREKVIKGEHLSTAFAASSLFPARIARWVAIGERVGHVEKVFSQLRVYYQREVEKWINSLMTLIEPAIIVVLGILIILFVILFIVPIFSLYGTIL
ncbi:MAG TPA: type II secretion system F family protein [Spirochaetia bacterium]|nr:type II secretion system F family protein [Spirochaetia bacterium]